MLNTFKRILKWFDFIHYCNRLHHSMGKNINALNFYVQKRSSILQTRTKSLKTVYLTIRPSGVWWFVKWVLQTETQKSHFFRASMVVTYYIKLFRTRADRHNGILMSLFPLVAETIIDFTKTIYIYIHYEILQFRLLDLLIKTWSWLISRSTLRVIFPHGVPSLNWITAWTTLSIMNFFSRWSPHFFTSAPPNSNSQKE